MNCSKRAESYEEMGRKNGSGKEPDYFSLVGAEEREEEPQLEMVGGLITGASPNLMQKDFFSLPKSLLRSFA